MPLRAGAKAGAPPAAGKPSLGEGLEAVSTRDWADEKAADSNGEALTVTVLMTVANRRRCSLLCR